MVQFPRDTFPILGWRRARERRSPEGEIKVTEIEGKIMLYVRSWTRNGRDYLALYPRDPGLSESRIQEQGGERGRQTEEGNGGRKRQKNEERETG